MMRVQIKSFAGIREADFTAAPIALLVGLNHQGKSSAVQAVAATLASRATVRRVDKKKDLDQLVNRGALDAWCQVTIGQQAARMSWPKGDYTTKGDSPPHASEIAVGLVSPLDADVKARAQFLAELLDATPKWEEFESTLAKIGGELFQAEQIKKCWAKIQSEGWDIAHRTMFDYTAAHKLAWGRVASEQYGKVKAETWRPQPWWPDLEAAGITEIALIGIVDSYKIQIDAAVATEAQSAARKAQLQREADKLEELATENGRLQRDEADARTALSAAETALKALPSLPTSQPQWAPCPHCKEPVVIRDGKLFAPNQAALSADEVALRRANLDNAEALVSQSRQSLDATQMRMAVVESEIATAEAAGDELARFQLAQADANTTELKRLRDEAEMRRKQFATWAEAHRIHTSTKVSQLITDELAPEGLRMRALLRAVDAFNDELQGLCKVIGYPALRILPDMEVRVVPTPYHILSDSERWVARLAFQLAVAMREGASAVVVDAAEVIEPPTRHKLLQMVLATKLPAIICMTVGKRDDVPDLSKIPGVGSTWWVEGGTVGPIA